MQEFNVSNPTHFGKINSSQNNLRLIVFIHGLNCDDPKKYWNELPSKLQWSCDINFDFLIWSYPTHIQPFDRIWSLFKRKRRLANWDDTARSILDGLEQIQQEHHDYDEITLVGHSQGGLISTLTGFHLDDTRKIAIKKIILCATPLTPQNLAWIMQIGTLWTNKDLMGLGSKKFFSAFDEFIVKNVRQRFKFFYMKAIHDEVVTDDPSELVFEEVKRHDGPHLWIGKAGINQSDGFKNLKSLIDDY